MTHASPDRIPAGQVLRARFPSAGDLVSRGCWWLTRCDARSAVGCQCPASPVAPHFASGGCCCCCCVCGVLGVTVRKLGVCFASARVTFAFWGLFRFCLLGGFCFWCPPCCRTLCRVFCVFFVARASIGERVRRSASSVARLENRASESE